MSTQTTVPMRVSGNEYLRVAEKQASILPLINDLLRESSTSKKSVDHDESTVIASVNSLLGAILTNRSLELVGPLYEMCKTVILAQVLKRAEQRGLPDGTRDALVGTCNEIRDHHPFAHGKLRLAV